MHKTKSNPDNVIYFGTIILNKTVHLQALGFTKQFYKYAWASSPDEAAKIIATWATAQMCEVNRVIVDKPAGQQDPHTYTFPHQIINLPKDVLEAIYEKRNYPPEYRNPGQYAQIAEIA